MWRSVCYELLKFRTQKKNYVMLFGHLGFLALCYLAYRSNKSTRGLLHELQKAFPDSGLAEFLNSCFDGPFFARLVIIPTFIILMPIVVATIAGDTVAGEMQDGSMKLYLARPRERWKVIVSKFLATYLVTMAYTFYFAIATLLVAVLLRGWSPSQVICTWGLTGGDAITFAIMEEPEALIRYFGMALYFSFSLMTLGSITLFFSTLFNRMTAATVVAMTIYFVSYIVALLPFSEVIRPYMLSEIIGSGTSNMFWMPAIPWQKVFSNIAVLGMYITGALTFSIINFNVKNIK